GVRHVDREPGIGCVGTFARVVQNDAAAAESIISRPENHDDIKRALLWDSPIIHGSIVVDKEKFLQAGGYKDHYRYCADLDLYDRLVPLCRTANIAKTLLVLLRHHWQGSEAPVHV